MRPMASSLQHYVLREVKSKVMFLEQRSPIQDCAIIALDELDLDMLSIDEVEE